MKITRYSKLKEMALGGDKRFVALSNQFGNDIDYAVINNQNRSVYHSTGLTTSQRTTISIFGVDCMTTNKQHFEMLLNDLRKEGYKIYG